MSFVGTVDRAVPSVARSGVWDRLLGSGKGRAISKGDVG